MLYCINKRSGTQTVAPTTSKARSTGVPPLHSMASASPIHGGPTAVYRSATTSTPMRWSGRISGCKSRFVLPLSRSHSHPCSLTLARSRISVDTRLHTLLDLQFKEPFWKRGDFPQTVRAAFSSFVFHPFFPVLCLPYSPMSSQLEN